MILKLYNCLTDNFNVAGCFPGPWANHLVSATATDGSYIDF